MKIINGDEKTFITRDLNLAATLCTLGFEMQGIDYQVEGNKPEPVGYFCFSRTPELETADKDYFKKKLLVEPVKFMTEVRALRAQVTNVYKGPRSNWNRTA